MEVDRRHRAGRHQMRLGCLLAHRLIRLVNELVEVVLHHLAARRQMRLGCLLVALLVLPLVRLVNGSVEVVLPCWASHRQADLMYLLTHPSTELVVVVLPYQTDHLLSSAMVLLLSGSVEVFLRHQIVHQADHYLAGMKESRLTYWTQTFATMLVICLMS